MLSKIAGIATGYLLAWATGTPQGRKAAAQFGRAAMRQMGEVEQRIIASFKKGLDVSKGGEPNGQDGEREVLGQPVLRENENDRDGL